MFEAVRDGDELLYIFMNYSIEFISFIVLLFFD